MLMFLTKHDVVERQFTMKTRGKRDFICDIDWQWSDSLPAQGVPGPVKKSQKLTLTMSHNPTRISLVRSVPMAQIEKDKSSKLRSQLWLELLEELQRQALIRQHQGTGCDSHMNLAGHESSETGRDVTRPRHGIRSLEYGRPLKAARQTPETA